MEEPWAQLVSTTDLHAEPVPIAKPMLMIGRSEGNDILLASNRFVSGKHCYIEKDNAGIVWLHDTSRNGTMLNTLKTTCQLHEEKVQLNHGDEIHVVKRSDITLHNVAFLFQEIQKLKEEEKAWNSSDNSTISDESNATLAYDDSFPTSKQALESEEETELPSKRPKIDDASTSGIALPSLPDDAVNITKTDDVSSVATEDVTGECKSCEQAAKTTTADHVVPRDEKSQNILGNSVDSLEETLICAICQDILYNCISLQPCMHSFCACCYSEWMQKADDCPTCRLKVERINKNHLVNNLVEAFLKANPGKRRSEEEMKELDAKNKITADMLKPKRRRRHDDEDDYSTESQSESDVDDGNDYNGPVVFPALQPWLPIGGGQIFQAPINFGGISVRPFRTVCRQCPGYNANLKAGPSCSNNPELFSFGKVKVTVSICYDDDRVVFDCELLRVRSSSSLMRDHDKLIAKLPSLPLCIVSFTYSGAICLRMSCHLYWGCQKAGCHGCLSKFKDFCSNRTAAFYNDIMNGLILDNSYESSIFKNYIESKGIALNELLDECIKRLAALDYECPDQRHLLNDDAAVCYSCARRSFAELAYQYRRDLPQADLPLPADIRPDCYWGRSCRTQRNKPEHARKFNHICEQTRHM